MSGSIREERMSTAFITAVLLSLFSAVFSQTDWSDGNGIAGPVTDWNAGFDCSTGIDWAGGQGMISLVDAASFPETITSDLESPACLGAADIDSDGDIDVVCAGFEADKLVWLEHIAPAEWIMHDVDTNLPGCCATCVLDMNEDGFPDIINASEATGAISWYGNNGCGTAWQKHTISAGGGNPFSLQGRDIDGDGDMDVVGALYGTARIVVWENSDGSGDTWILHNVKTGFPGAWWVECADMDDDGDWDINACRYGGFVCWFENQGFNGDWEQHDIASGLQGLVHIAVADMDMDGDNDLVSASMIPGRLCLHENTGEGTDWISTDLDTDLQGPWSCTVSDLDGDGDFDILSNDRPGGYVYWYENTDADATRWVRHLLGDGYDLPNSLLATDIDGNGIQDPVGSIADDNSVIWWSIQNGYPSDGFLRSSILDAGEDAAWGIMEWSCGLPASTWISMEVRAGQDPDDLGEWLLVENSGDDLSSLISEPSRYFQYRATLSSGDPYSTPFLTETTLNAELLGVDEYPGISGMLSFPSPCSPGAVPVSVILLNDGCVSVNIFDSAGRMVDTIRTGCLSRGTHVIHWNSSAFPAGAYTVRFTTPDRSGEARVVLIP